MLQLRFLRTFLVIAAGSLLVLLLARLAPAPSQAWVSSSTSDGADRMFEQAQTQTGPPADLTGRALSIMTVDAANQVVESNENNNVSAVQLPIPTPRPTCVAYVFLPIAFDEHTTDVVSGAVEIANRSCCIGGTAGERLAIPVAFSATSTVTNIQAMRVRTGGNCADMHVHLEGALSSVPWRGART